MTELKKKRYDAVKRVIKDYGIRYNDQYIMSIWDLAFSANNIWLSPLFLTKKKEEKITKTNTSSMGYAIGDWQLYELFTGIKHAVRCTDIEILKSKPNDMLYLKCDSKVIEDNK